MHIEQTNSMERSPEEKLVDAFAQFSQALHAFARACPQHRLSRSNVIDRLDSAIEHARRNLVDGVAGPDPT
jgi:hypothetical protein